MTENKHFVYIIQCGDGTYYTGYTTNVRKRIELHESGQGAKYTRGRGPFQLVFEKEFSTKRKAMQEEWNIKQMTRRQKENLIYSVVKGGSHESTTKLPGF
ncbi:GIY-YIG nuclease family protein [Alteribacillus iranensis]|uniref:Putative endonuclease n=1 Tax=Alteribacillus iranensis TaxID=930128 RepID=A0A1I2FE91_9BACI|nr:GIY-YIG nuclease family protein [Alteribacillus iranensis]SFF03209.1 putative endonuclease [Alteribacillus iranensis]